MQLTAMWHIPRRTAGCTGRIYLVLPQPPDNELIAWCMEQPGVTDAKVIEPEKASLGITLGEPSQHDYIMARRIHTVVDALSTKLNCGITRHGITIWNHQWRERQGRLFTPEMQFLTDGGPFNTVPFTGIIGWPDLERPSRRGSDGWIDFTSNSCVPVRRPYDSWWRRALNETCNLIMVLCKRK